MTESTKILYEGGMGELEEKKSRFIAQTLPITTSEEALEFIESIKKKYWDARHHCYAYVLGDRQEIQRYSDDGEPCGTAGKPMLDVLLGEDVHNLVVVVTRYFGGTLLGTGGLVRAYSHATKKGLDHSVILEKQAGKKYSLITDYTDLGKIQYLLSGKQIPVLSEDYSDTVNLEILLPAKEEASIREALINLTNGKIQIQEKEACFFGIHKKEVLLL